MKKIVKSLMSLILSVALVVTAIPVNSYAEGENTTTESGQELSFENDYISVHMSDTNGGFYISNKEGDKTIKSDNNIYASDFTFLLKK